MMRDTGFGLFPTQVLVLLVVGFSLVRVLQTLEGQRCTERD